MAKVVKEDRLYLRIDPNTKAVLEESFADYGHDSVSGFVRWIIKQYLRKEIKDFEKNKGS